MNHRITRPRSLLSGGTVDVRIGRAEVDCPEPHLINLRDEGIRTLERSSLWTRPMSLVDDHLELACIAQRFGACHEEVEVSKPDHLERLE